MPKFPRKPHPLTVHPNAYRLAQVARAKHEKLFDAERRAVFLLWFAATCNVTLACEKAGIDRGIVYRHRRKDTAFAEAWDEALAQGYAALEAGLLADAIAAETPQADENDEQGELPPPASPLTFEQRMALLKEYRRPDGGRGPRKVGKQATVPGRVASPDEVEAELIRRLKHFALRVAQADAEGRDVLDEPARSARSGIPITKPGDGRSK